MQQHPGQANDSQPAHKRRTKRLSTINEEFDLALFVIIAQKKWKWIAAIFIISFVVAVLYLRYAQRIYEANATIQIGSENTA
ncbi:MAG TPA: Wzz/FepE/Etk N-terminal domain-containing protein, partial [Bacteroidia bacterium]|nr:Wzz/FepE/Etk N-terminal domain-containing protein [Bacteroidia bacterium]